MELSYTKLRVVLCFDQIFLSFTATVSAFAKLEQATGKCSGSKFAKSYSDCLDEGGSWRGGLDISGHCFLLVSCNLAIIEEARAYLSWEKVKDMIRNEQHKRTELTNRCGHL